MGKHSFASGSTVENINSEPTKSPFMAREASNIAGRKASSTIITLPVSTRMVLSPQQVNICLKTGNQVFNFAALVVLPHGARTIHNAGQAVSVLMCAP
ncbi:hypothetical protein [Izhakiella capsodis]|uniref:hypothetical protein n=1 Tax=Izhakiella capsodis TaxID=1367852 RepID=UPI000B884D00|nr:hypothetical protein [Izhakiella capsodis]